MYDCDAVASDVSLATLVLLPVAVKKSGNVYRGGELAWRRKEKYQHRS